MNFDDIKNSLNNPEFKIDIATFLLELKADSLMNSYKLDSILKRQIEILELQKGKTGQELENAVESEIEMLDDKYSEWLKNDLIDVVNGYDI
ncbi:hypothetical protein LPB03_14965 [Polaribacter vadi]|uniref:Uncharacterized protein n=2 Tax=Polaribacter vadi TaxID=1774273 RepID=A0A1B8TQQ3_9FLAO|nr:hypothetical protein [Polaribacter vadi]AOW18675.1 hypothetical protein LPB03_14965 [Polaribacter vadi]OBY61963.1 hypothetical protein LPB3_14345 [Polaribacter vadi]